MSSTKKSQPNKQANKQADRRASQLQAEDLRRLGLAVIETEAAGLAEIAGRIDDNFVEACRYMLDCGGRILRRQPVAPQDTGGKLDGNLTIGESDQRRLRDAGLLHEKRQQQRLGWMQAMINESLRRQLAASPAVQRVRDQIEQDVLAGQLPATTGAKMLLDAFSEAR